MMDVPLPLDARRRMEIGCTYTDRSDVESLCVRLPLRETKQPHPSSSPSTSLSILLQARRRCLHPLEGRSDLIHGGR